MTVVGLLRPAVSLLFFFTAVLGLAYPAVVTAAARILFPVQASGSVVHACGRAVGSNLVGQAFSSPSLFWGRPSATPSHPCNAEASSGSNLGPTNPALLEAVRTRVAALRVADPGATGAVPVDLVTASGSGLDPDISPQSALFQVRRVARARGLEESVVRQLVEESTRGPVFGLLGEPRVRVLDLNLALACPEDSPHGIRRVLAGASRKW